MNEQEMTLKGYVGQLHKCHTARKEYELLVSAACDDTDGRVASNISAIRDIHERTLEMIREMCSQSLCVHPEYLDSYPKIMGVVETHQRNSKKIGLQKK